MAASPTKWLALDLATKTGWAHSDGDSGMHDFQFSSEEVIGARIVRLLEWLESAKWWPALTDWAAHPVNVVYEQAHQRGGAPTRSAMALVHGVELFCYRNRFPVYNVHARTLKKHATGNGNCKKDAMIRAALEKWPDKEIYDDNQVDALWLLDYAQENFNHEQS